MDLIETLVSQNADYAANDFRSGLKIMPSQRLTILGCVDPRVDPMDILKLQPGQAAIIRNVGGRVTPALLETMQILGTVSKAAGQEIGEGWNFVVLHHTNCGIVGCYHNAPEMLARHMGVGTEGLDALAVTDPYKAVEVDVAALRANPKMRADVTITGMVYDTATGRISVVVPPSRLRPEAA